MVARLRGSLMLTALLLAAAVAFASDSNGSFDRTLQVNGPVDLDVKTASGRISVRNGNAGQVTVHGTIRANEGWLFGSGCGMSADEKVKALQDHPPIEQTGNSIRIGHINDERMRCNVSISYDIVVPADTRLISKTGSGSQEVEGIRGPAEVQTGSGDIKVTDVDADLRAHTGSGSIDLDGIAGSLNAETGSGSIRGRHIGGLMKTQGSKMKPVSADASSVRIDAHTGSGRIELEQVTGAVTASAGSGSIHVQGDPTGNWDLHSGSGGVEVELPQNAAFTIDAETGSGGITVDQPVTIQGSVSKRALRGTVRGGGVELRLRTGSGGIRVR